MPTAHELDHLKSWPWLVSLGVSAGTCPSWTEGPGARRPCVTDERVELLLPFAALFPLGHEPCGSDLNRSGASRRAGAGDDTPKGTRRRTLGAGGPAEDCHRPAQRGARPHLQSRLTTAPHGAFTTTLTAAPTPRREASPRRRGVGQTRRRVCRPASDLARKGAPLAKSKSPNGPPMVGSRRQVMALHLRRFAPLQVRKALLYTCI